MPRGNRRLPDACVRNLEAADLIVHAGDLVGLSVLDELNSYAPVIAVHGNVDDPAVRSALPRTVEVDVRGTRIAVIHDAGPVRGRLERLRRNFPNADVVVFGHSHLPLHAQVQGGFQIFNPGSPTERRRAPWPSMGVAQVESGRLSVELIRLG